MQLIALVLAVVVAPCSGLRRNATTGVVPLANSMCALTTAFAGSSDDDESLTGGLNLPLSTWGSETKTPAGVVAKTVDTTAGGDMAEFKAAIQEYKDQKSKYKSAEGRLMNAMEHLLRVPSVDGPGLEGLLKGKRQDTLVVFYAPWCPHCQSFVLHDKQGDPTKAPLEVLYKKIQENDASKSTNVVRFDIQKSGGVQGKAIPSAFELEGIPTVFFVGGEGMKVSKFAGDPHDSAALFDFVVAQSK